MTFGSLEIKTENCFGDLTILTLNCNSPMEIKISNIGQRFCVLGMWSVQLCFHFSLNCRQLNTNSIQVQIT